MFFFEVSPTPQSERAGENSAACAVSYTYKCVYRGKNTLLKRDFEWITNRTLSTAYKHLILILVEKVRLHTDVFVLSVGRLFICSFLFYFILSHVSLMLLWVHILSECIGIPVFSSSHSSQGFSFTLILHFIFIWLWIICIFAAVHPPPPNADKVRSIFLEQQNTFRIFELSRFAAKSNRAEENRLLSIPELENCNFFLIWCYPKYPVCFPPLGTLDHNHYEPLGQLDTFWVIFCCSSSLLYHYFNVTADEVEFVFSFGWVPF